MISEAVHPYHETPSSLFQLEYTIGNYSFWQDHDEEIQAMIEASFDGISDSQRMLLTYNVRFECSDYNTTLALLRASSDNSLVGITSWYTLRKTDIEDCEPFKKLKAYEDTSDEDIRLNTVLVGTTAIVPQYRHKGGWTLLMNGLDGNVSQEGYRFMLRYARTANEYSEKVKQRYQGKIIHEEEIEGLGKQMAYWILLGDHTQLVR